MTGIPEDMQPADGGGAEIPGLTPAAPAATPAPAGAEFDLEPTPGSRRSSIGVSNLPARHDLRQICKDESFHNTTRNSQDANDSNLLETNQSSLGLTPASPGTKTSRFTRAALR